MDTSCKGISFACPFSFAAGRQQERLITFAVVLRWFMRQGSESLTLSYVSASCCLADDFSDD